MILCVIYVVNGVWIKYGNNVDETQTEYVQYFVRKTNSKFYWKTNKFKYAINRSVTTSTCSNHSDMYNILIFNKLMYIEFRRSLSESLLFI